jgi:SAM-dependent methyltransferase
MASVLTAETDTYAEMWGHPAYSVTAPGESYAPVFRAMVAEQCQGFGSVLDAGCGTGRGALALKALGFDVALCDVTDAGLDDAARDLPFFRLPLWANLRGALGCYDWVYCTDVLEHLPTEYTMLAVARLLEVARDGLFLTVATQADSFGVWVNRPLHQTVQPYIWWRDRLAELGTVRDARDLLTNALFVVEP